jgi:hypothetical protein
VRLAIEDVRKLPEYLTLCSAHRKFIDELIANDYDSVRAAHIAYPDHARPDILSAGLMSHWKISLALDRHFGRPLIDRIMLDLWTVIRQCQRAKGKLSKEQASALKISVAFYERMTGQSVAIQKALRGLRNPVKGKL